eukprot:GHVS01067869.1.p1 GENE.GHVS01067869.1~~GHVS01067869.1.p1  ORF type:complete len:131 (+),score=28.94 GHVS01067869.1:301-693(+)
MDSSDGMPKMKTKEQANEKVDMKVENPSSVLKDVVNTYRQKQNDSEGEQIVGQQQDVSLEEANLQEIAKKTNQENEMVKISETIKKTDSGGIPAIARTTTEETEETVGWSDDSEELREKSYHHKACCTVQ